MKKLFVLSLIALGLSLAVVNESEAGWRRGGFFARLFHRSCR